MKTAKPKRRNPMAACLSNAAYRPKRVPDALAKARLRERRPKHRGADRHRDDPAS